MALVDLGNVIGPQGPEGSLPDNFVVTFSDGSTANGTYTETVEENVNN